MYNASKPGQSPVKLEKRSSDISVFEIDCTNLQPDTKYLFYGTPAYTLRDNSTISIQSARIVKGKILVIAVAGGPPNIPFLDENVNFIVSCTNGAKLTVPVVIRCYSV